MKFDIKINEYKNNIETLKAVESLEVYRWLISLGEKLSDDPLTKIKRIALPIKLSPIIRLTSIFLFHNVNHKISIL